MNSYFDLTKMKIADYRKEIQSVFEENNFSIDDLIKREQKVVSIDEVIKLSKNELFSFQSHTFNHESLGMCNEKEIEFEFFESKSVLESKTGKNVFSICYPYGSKEVIGNKIFKLVSKYYTSGFSLVQGVCTKNTDIFLIPRIGIYPGDRLIGFTGKIYHYTNKFFFNL
jgi:peptidoglycan/xylan/chitin deacetylase (PgdA/CDA1 family)